MRVGARLHSSRVVRCGTALASVLGLTVLASGCSFATTPAHSATASASSSRPAPTTSGAATGSAPVPAATAELAGSVDGRPASLRIAVGAPQRGFPPKLVPGDCGLTPDATEYVEVSVVFTDRTPLTKEARDSNLRLDLSVAGGTGAGVLVTSSEPTADCNNTSVLPSTTTLQSQNLLYQHQTMTVYVVARTTAATADPLRGVTLQLRNPRHHPDSLDARDWTWNVEHATGSACPANPSELCVPIA